MPEGPELRISADFITKVSNDKKFSEVILNPISKVNTDLSILNNNEFTIKAESRGKELRLIFNNQSNHLYFAMGMTGCWYFDEVSNLSKYKHWKILFRTGDHYLIFSDIRRFATWRWMDNWSKHKGPCIMKEFEEFKSNIFDNIESIKLSKPLMDILFDQQYFNGLGAYLISEIIGRLNINPKNHLSELDPEELDDLLFLCNQVPSESYELGGGQLKDWKNPFNKDSKIFKEWLMFYQNKKYCKSLKNKLGRTIWVYNLLI